MRLRELLFVAALLGALPAGLQAQTAIISQATAQRHGLVRAWRTQVELDRSVDRIAYVTQQGGMLYVQTSHAMVHALDAETGKRLGSAQVGRRTQVSLAPGVNDDLLAVINGSSLFVVDRKTGRMKYERQLVGAPGAGPALDKNLLVVGMTDGLLQGFDLEHPNDLPWVYKSAGRILIQPVVTENSLSWTTDKGYFYVADADTAKVRFRVETQGEINSRPAHWTPYLYACSLDGYVYAVDEITGKTIWKFSSGQPISKQPTAVEDQVFILPDLGGMFCLDGKTGQERWFAPGISEFCSVSPKRVYAVDHLNRLATLDRKFGSRLDTLPLGDVSFKLMNQQTDRIYLIGNDGVIQCLHESGLDTPVTYTPPRFTLGGQAATKQKPQAEEGERAAQPPAQKPAADEAQGEENENAAAADPDNASDKD